MRIVNVKEFNKALRTLRDCAKMDKSYSIQRHNFHDVIWLNDSKMYATNGIIAAIADINNCMGILSESVNCIIPSDSKINESVEFDGNKLHIDGKLVDCEQFDAKFYKNVIPTAQPCAEITLDFSGYRNLNLGYDVQNYPHVMVGANGVEFQYRDELETSCVVEDCVSSVSDNFPTMKFVMKDFFTVLKASKKFKIYCHNVMNSPVKIVADNFEFIIKPIKIEK